MPQWTDCAGTDGGVGYQCGYLDVPMDYANSSAGKASLALARYPYSVEPRLGTLFINPGTAICLLQLSVWRLRLVVVSMQLEKSLIFYPTCTDDDLISALMCRRAWWFRYGLRARVGPDPQFLHWWPV